MRYGLVRGARNLREVSVFVTSQRIDKVFVNLVVRGKAVDPSAVDSLMEHLRQDDEVIIPTVTTFDSIEELSDLVEACRTKGATLTSVDENITQITDTAFPVFTAVKRLVTTRYLKAERVCMGPPIKSLRANFYIEYQRFRGRCDKKISAKEAAKRLGISRATFTILVRMFEGRGGDDYVLGKQGTTAHPTMPN